MSSPSDPVLIALLDKPLPRGMRCNTCMQCEIDSSTPTVGWCTEHDHYVGHKQGCVYWQPADDCGLDYMGVPLASPLAQEN